MVGWLGPDTPVSDLFEATPALEGLWAWDATEQRYLHAWRDGDEGLPTLTPGLGLWIYVSGDAAVAWEQPVAADSVVLELREGPNLVAWAGQDLPVRDTLTRLGDSLVRVDRWNAEHQQFELHIPGAPHSADTLSQLGPGDGLWLHLSTEAYWWVPGTKEPRFQFADGVTAEEQQTARRTVETAMAVFAERFGVYTTDFTVSVHTDVGCSASPRFMTLTRESGCAAHEYFHVLQFALAKGGPLGPGWMIEGPADYASAVYHELLDQGEGDDLDYSRARWFAVAGSVHVPSLEHLQGAYEPTVNYKLGFLAAEWLVDHAGPSALANYYERLPSASSWQSAFKAAFGTSTRAFYTDFEAYRAEAAPPLPHLLDNLEKPVAAFLGDVPEDTRSAIHIELESVHTFFTEQLGADAVEFTVYVGSNPDASRAAYKRLFQTGTVEEACSVAGAVLFHVLTCSGELTYERYLSMYVAALLQDKAHSDDPLWLNFGGSSYTDSLYRRAHRLPTVFGESFDEELGRYAQLARQSAVPLRSIEGGEGWAAPGPDESRALGFLAVDWLARHAGEGALIEYFRLLPRGHPSFPWHEPNAGSWQEAFEQAFDLTIDDFYTAFAAYRQTL